MMSKLKPKLAELLEDLLKDTYVQVKVDSVGERSSKPNIAHSITAILSAFESELPQPIEDIYVLPQNHGDRELISYNQGFINGNKKMFTDIKKLLGDDK
jgi:hypothetical protein